MKLFKLCKAELKKIFYRPVMWFIFVSLVVSLTLLTTLFNPTKTNSSNQTISGINVNAIYQQFLNDSNQNSKTKLDSALISTKNDIEIITNNAKDDKQLKDFKEKIATTEASFEIVKIKIKNYSQNTTPISEVATALDNLKLNAGQVVVYMNQTLTDENISFYITNSEFDTIQAFFSKLNNSIPSSYSNMNEQIPELYTYLANNFDFKNISNIILNLKSFNINQQNIDLLIDKYYFQTIDTENIDSQSKLNQISAQINEFSKNNSSSILEEDFQKINTLISNYTSTAKMSGQILKDSFKVEIASEIKSSKIQEYKGFSDFNEYNLKNSIAKNTYLLENNLFDYNYLSPFNFNQSGEQINAFDFTIFSMQILGLIIAIFSIFIGGSQIAGESASGTLKMIAIRPYSRNKIVLSKFLATIMFMIFMTAISLISSFVVGFISYGVTTTDVLVVFNASKTFILNGYLLLLIYFVSIILTQTFFIAFSIMLSSIIKSSTFSVLTGFIVYLLNIILTPLLYAKSWFKFIPFANVDLYKYFGATTLGNIFGFNISYGNNFVFSAIYLFSSIIFFTLISLTTFARKEIK